MAVVVGELVIPADNFKYDCITEPMCSLVNYFRSSLPCGNCGYNIPGFPSVLLHYAVSVKWLNLNTIQVIATHVYRGSVYIYFLKLIY